MGTSPTSSNNPTHTGRHERSTVAGPFHNRLSCWAGPTQGTCNDCGWRKLCGENGKSGAVDYIRIKTGKTPKELAKAPWICFMRNPDEDRPNDEIRCAFEA